MEHDELTIPPEEVIEQMKAEIIKHVNKEVALRREHRPHVRAARTMQQVMESHSVRAGW